jgi:hypothetical protein
MLRHIPNDRASAVLHGQVFHRDRALVAVAMAVQGFDLGGEGVGAVGWTVLVKSFALAGSVRGSGRPEITMIRTSECCCCA